MAARDTAITDSAMISEAALPSPVRCGGVVLFVLDVAQNERC